MYPVGATAPSETSTGKMPKGRVFPRSAASVQSVHSVSEAPEKPPGVKNTTG